MRAILKRDGRVVPFDPSRIESAISRAFAAVGSGEAGGDEAGVSRRLAEEVADIARSRFKDSDPGVEDIQDIVEDVLINGGCADAARAYILYRERRREVREAKGLLGIRDDLKLPVNAIEVLQRRYLKRDASGRVAETPGEMFMRVARHVSSAETLFGGDGGDRQGCCDKFFETMRNMLFLPNSPTLMNAGLPLGQLSACFVLPVEDSIEGIFDSLKHMAMIHQSGGGTGFSFSRLRPRNDVVRATGGVASGPLPFMRVFDVATDVIKQGGRRRGANMGVLSVKHPDILDFIAAKERQGLLENFNLSVAVTDDFIQRARSGGDLPLINPRSGEAVGSLDAPDLLRMIATAAWRNGEPGVLFIDRINALHPIPGTIEATNPCGEQPLLPYESCNLGSVNLSRLVQGGEIDWDGLDGVVRLGVRFLDDVLGVNRFPLKQIEGATLQSRKIGLGVMGFAEMLIEMGISYASPEAVTTAEKVMGFISRAARDQSRVLGAERGSFPLFEESRLRGYGSMRNATVTTIAPTGTIGIIAGTSSGIEPLFAVAFTRRVLDGARMVEVSPLFEAAARAHGIYSRDLRAEVARKGRLRDIDGVPSEMKELFATALEIPPEQHVRVQAAFQKYTDSAVSKTVNLPAEASVSDVIDVYNLAYDLGCKGITVYRYGSREQVMYLGEEGVGCPICS